jgi:hypothetical protein
MSLLDFRIIFGPELSTTRSHDGCSSNPFNLISFMSTTTQILFNSPALHSLKREQLVKLCKIHSLKANGKNLDLIQRLRQHAQCLPKDAPLSVAARSEDDAAIPCQLVEADCDEQVMQEPSFQSRPRPSEQWDVVMDSIEELEENSSQGTLSSQRTVNNIGSGEFGTGGSSGIFLSGRFSFDLILL